MTTPSGGEFLRISATSQGEQLVDRLLRGIEDRARDVSPAWPQVYAEFRAITTKAFDTSGASTDLGPWPALAPKTIAERQRQGFGAGPILERTGALRRALTLGQGAYIRTTATRFTVQLASEPASVASFPYHQSPAPRRKLPRRAMISLTADQRTQLIRPIRLYVTGHDPTAPTREAIR